MTKEEAIKEIQDASDYEVRHGDVEHHHEDIMRRVEAFEKAVNALQKEPCEDAVSRGEVNMLCARYLKTATDDHVAFYEHFCDLPSVTPTRKKGKWERGYSFPDGEYVKCTVCGEIIKCIYPMHFCPNCGADMRGGEDGSN